ncbi:hypothetical protein [Ramlibacter sp. PS4R-6]|uniref:hypothetical protein n=1 Tax=Ramlibacter sp. PS4R-6 TaxID=3133438 RepID=UPI0030A6A0EA
MRTAKQPPQQALSSQCFRLTARGRACVALVEAERETLGSLSRYLHDVLAMCGTGIWFQHLQQFMPPRSLEESLKSLMALGLVEGFDQPELPLDAPQAAAA